MLGRHAPFVSDDSGAKCGTTALYHGIYEGVFHQDPFAHSNWGMIQRIHAGQWHGLFARQSSCG